MGRNKLVIIEWYDSNILHGWQIDLRECEVALSKDVGFLVQEDSNKIILARGISSHDLFNSPMAIPRGCIKSIKELRVK